MSPLMKKIGSTVTLAALLIVLAVGAAACEKTKGDSADKNTASQTKKNESNDEASQENSADSAGVDEKPSEG